MIRHASALVLALTSLWLAAGNAQASALPGPPGPPPPPPCAPCAGPPPPPTPVPTVAPTVVPVQPVVAVKLSDNKVSRGDTVKLAVDASTDDQVEIDVQYHKWKPKVYKSKVGSSGTIVQSWKIPKHAPIGKATVKVTVTGSTDTLTKTLDLEVTR